MSAPCPWVCAFLLSLSSLLCKRMCCIKAVGVGRGSRNAKGHSYSFHPSRRRRAPPFLPSSVQREDYPRPGLVLLPGPFLHGPSFRSPGCFPHGEEGTWLILEFRDLPCFSTTDSNQDTVSQPPFSLTELIPVHLQACEGRRGERKRGRERALEHVISPVRSQALLGGDTSIPMSPPLASLDLIARRPG